MCPALPAFASVSICARVETWAGPFGIVTVPSAAVTRGLNMAATRSVYAGSLPYHAGRSRYRCERCIAHPAAKYPAGYWSVTPRSVSKLGMLPGPRA